MIPRACGAVLRIRPLGGRLGAEVSGVPRDGDPTPEQVEALKDALAEHKALVVAGLRLTPEAHARLVRRLAGPAPRPGVRAGTATVPLDAAPPPASAVAARWIGDRSWALAPSKLVTFRAVTGTPALHFSDAAGAYRDLPRPLRALADHGWVVHDHPDPSTGAVAHPVTRLHPETGDRLLMLGAAARRVLELDDDASDAVLALLGARLDDAHNVLTWAGSPGDVVLVDGRSVLYRVAGAGGIARLAVPGEIPLGVDGCHSHPAGALDPAPRHDPAAGLLAVRSA